MVEELEEWRPGSFTKNFSWGRDGPGLQELHESIRIGFDGHVDDVPRDVFRGRIDDRGRSSLIPVNFFLFNRPVEGVDTLVADELVFQAIASPHSERFDKLALFAFLLSRAGRWKGMMKAQRYPALWANAFVRERVAGDGKWNASRISSSAISRFVADDPRYTGQTVGKLASNLNFIFEKGHVDGFSSKRIERWWVDCLFLALDRLIEDRRLDGTATSIGDYENLLRKAHFLTLTGGRTLEKDLAIKHLVVLYAACGSRNRFVDELVIERTKELMPDEQFQMPNDPRPRGAVHLTNPRVLKSIPPICAMLARYAGFVGIDPDEMEEFDLDEFVRRQTSAALEALKSNGIRPTMTAEELMRLTRDR